MTPPPTTAATAMAADGFPEYQPGKKGFFVLYGPPGGGKSTEAAKAFPKSLHIASAPNNLQFYSQWQPEHAATHALPYREIVIDEYAVTDSWSATKDQFGRIVPTLTFDAAGMPQRVPQKATLESYLAGIVQSSLLERAQGLPPTYYNLIIDESGEFWERIFAEIIPTCLSRGGAVDTRSAYVETARWSREIAGFIRQVTLAGMNVCLIAHEQDPDAVHGKKGGPKFVSQAIMKHLCSISDGNLLRDTESQSVLSLTPETPSSPAAAPAAAPALTPALTATPADAAALATPIAPVAPVAPAAPDLAQLLLGGGAQQMRRIWKVHLDKNWMSKLRGIPDSMYDEVKDMELIDILRLAGFVP